MATWTNYPLIYEINTWAWLHDLSRKAQKRITLATVPDEEIVRLAELKLDGLWLMGVWQRSPGGLKVALEDARLVPEYVRSLPDFTPQDVVGSPYSIYGYQVDTALGGDEELAILRQRLNQFGMRLMLDFVPNHMAIDHPWLTEHPERFVQGTPDLLEQQPDRYFRLASDQGEWIFAHGRDPYYGCWYDTVQLDYRSLATRQAMTEVLLDIAGRCDGARCDMAMLVTHDVFLKTWGGVFDPPQAEFWEDAIAQVKARYPDFLTLAEVYWSLEVLLQQQGFDYTYDKSLYDHLPHDDAQAVQAHLLATMPFQSRPIRFIENHDEQRSMTVFGSERIRAAATLTLTLPGSRLIHEGQIEGYQLKLPVQLGRRPQEPTEPGLDTFYLKLLSALHEPIFHAGEWTLLNPEPAWPGNPTHQNFIAYQWNLDDEYWLVIINLTHTRSQCRLKLSQPGLAGRLWRLMDILDEKGYPQNGDELLDPGMYVDRPGYGCHLGKIVPVREDQPEVFDLSEIQFRNTLVGHKSGIYALAWSPKDQLLASSGQEKKILIWNTNDASIVGRLDGHKEAVDSLAWSKDGRLLASGSNDRTVCIWDVTQGTLLKKLRGHQDNVLCLAWSPDSQTLASGSIDRTIRLWDVKSSDCLTLTGHSDSINSIAWSPDGKFLASGSGDQTIRLWDTVSYRRRQVFNGHDWVCDIAWSPDSKLIAAGTGGGTVDIWSSELGRLIAICEGHTRRILGVTFSPDGRLLVSKSNDNTLRFWKSDSWTSVAVVSEYGEYLTGVAFHPSKSLLATRDDQENTIRILEVDTHALFGEPPVEPEIYYKNAKAVLVGDSGVGKTGLWLVLTDQPYIATDSSHGRHVWTFDYQEVDIGLHRKETREILIWDLAGQPGYRLTHQLHLNEVVVALLVFDSRSETDPLAGVNYWNRALDQAWHLQGDATLPMKKFLVAARTDRTGVGLSAERIGQVKRELGFDAYFATSAKEGWQISELRQAIREAINWEAIPRGSSSKLFQRIKNFLVEMKKNGWLLLTVESLYLALLASPASEPDEIPLKDSDELREQFEHCIRLVQSRDLIRRLSFGNLVLLQPELLDAYASALVDAAREEPDGMGNILEEIALTGRFKIPDSERIQNQEQEKLLLIAMIEDLLRSEIALREQTSEGAYLIFPSQITRRNPDLPEPKGKAIIFTFEGPLQNIYTTLAVRLSHSGLFKRDEMWKNATSFTASVGGKCGIYLHELQEGQGELVLFFDQATSEATRFQFEEYVLTHLDRRVMPGKLSRRRVFICPSCGTPVSDIAARRRYERGFDWIACNVDDTHISLLDGEERLAATLPSTVPEMDRQADFMRDMEVARSRLEGKRATGEFDVFLCYNKVDLDEVRAIARLLKERGLLPWLDEDEMRPGLPWQAILTEQIGKIKSAAVFVGKEGIGPWQEQEIYALLTEFQTRGCPVIPVLLNSVTGKVPPLPVFLKNMVWVDFRKWDTDPLSKLIWGVTGSKYLS